MHQLRLNKVSPKVKGLAVLEYLWIQVERDEDASKVCEFEAHGDQETECMKEAIEVRSTTSQFEEKIVEYHRSLNSVIWTRGTENMNDRLFPLHANICPQAFVPFRTAKIHTQFREKLLHRIYDVQRILCNMVLFRCYTCNRRFPTFHPEHQPPFDLQCLTSCSLKVASFDQAPPSERSALATLHTGRCQKCQDNLDKSEKDELLKGVAIFSLENQMDIVMG